MQPEVVYAAVLDAGYPEAVAELSAKHFPLFDGDVDKLVDLVEAITDAADAPYPSLEGCTCIYEHPLAMREWQAHPYGHLQEPSSSILGVHSPNSGR